MRESFDVSALGNAIVDVLARVDDAFLRSLNIEKGGYQPLTETESLALYKRIPPATELSGGSAANTIAGLASFGLKTAYMGTYKNDEFGRIFAHDLHASGVHFPSQPFTRGPGTGRSIILVAPDAERAMNTYMGASVAITPDTLIDEVVASSKIFCSEAYVWEPTPAQQTLFKGAKICKESGTKFALTLSDQFYLKRHAAEVRSFITDHVDILIGNVDEAKTLYQTDSREDALKQVQVSCDIAAITDGKNGSYLLTKDAILHVERFPTNHVVDTTGAGDAYACGFLYGILSGLPLTETGKIASIIASDIITHLGSRPDRSYQRILQEKLVINL